MKTIHQINKEQEVKLSNLYKEFGVFFAFSDKQFLEQRKEGVKYVSDIGGMLIPKDNVNKFWNGFDKIGEETKAELAEHIPMDDYIHYNLSNYESYFSGDLSRTYEAVLSMYPQCTTEDVVRVYNKRVQKERECE